MTIVSVEATRDRIIVTGPTADAVREETLALFMRCSCAFADFTYPVSMPDGSFMATGRVRLTDSDSKGPTT